MNRAISDMCSLVIPNRYHHRLYPGHILFGFPAWSTHRRNFFSILAVPRILYSGLPVECILCHNGLPAYFGPFPEIENVMAFPAPLFFQAFPFVDRLLKDRIHLFRISLDLFLSARPGPVMPGRFLPLLPCGRKASVE